MSRPCLVCRSGAALLICLLGCANASSILAQGIGGGVLIQTYSFDDAEVVGHGEFQLLTAPFAASVALGPNLGVVAPGVWAKASRPGRTGRRSRSRGSRTRSWGSPSASASTARSFSGGGVTLPTGQSHSDAPRDRCGRCGLCRTGEEQAGRLRGVGETRLFARSGQLMDTVVARVPALR